MPYVAKNKNHRLKTGKNVADSMRQALISKDLSPLVFSLESGTDKRLLSEDLKYGWVVWG